jgi:hypothetical protein
MNHYPYFMNWQNRQSFLRYGIKVKRLERSAAVERLELLWFYVSRRI